MSRLTRAVAARLIGPFGLAGLVAAAVVVRPWPTVPASQWAVVAVGLPLGLALSRQAVPARRGGTRFSLVEPVVVPLVLLVAPPLAAVTVGAMCLGDVVGRRWYRSVFSVTLWTVAAWVASSAGHVLVDLAAVPAVPGPVAAERLTAAAAAASLLFTALTVFGVACAEWVETGHTSSVADLASELLVVPVTALWSVAVVASYHLSWLVGLVVVSLPLVLVGYGLRYAKLSIAHQARHREREELLGQVLDELARQRSELVEALHDGPLQDVIAALMLAEGLGEQVGDGEPAPGGLDVGQDLADLTSALTSAVAGMRQLQGAADERVLEHLSLEQALGELAAEMAGRFPGGVPVWIDPLPELSAEQRVALFRVVREALVNAAKHADASQVAIRVGVDGPDLVATVTDNGRGLPEQVRVDARRAGHLGLVLMRERIELLGGELVLDSAPGAGTSVTARLPVVTG